MTPYTQDSFSIGDSDSGAHRPDSTAEAGTAEENSGAAAEGDTPPVTPDSVPSEGARPDEASTDFFSAGVEQAGEGRSDWLDHAAPTVLPLNRPRAVRPSLAPRRAVLYLVAAVVAVVAIVVAFVLVNQTSLREVPQITGIDMSVATQRLAGAGFKIAVAERRFAPQPAGTVLTQNPVAGSKLKRGMAVTVVVSAGTEEFTMPDVVGDGLLLARGILESRGLDIRVEPQPSDQPSDTVLATSPSAGQTVHTGDIVHVTVAAQGPSSQVLLPSDMKGVVVIIDEQPVEEGQADVPVDVARRLRSLIEASNGKVVDTRALADTGTAVAAPMRSQRAAAVASATVAVGIRTVTSGPSGIVVLSPAATLPQTLASGKLSSQIAAQFAAEGLKTQQTATSGDDVFGVIAAPWVRMQLGSFSSKDDTSQFSNPSWEDKVARALYRAIAQQYGRKPPAKSTGSKVATP